MDRMRKMNVSRFAAWGALVLLSATSVLVLGDDSSSRPAGISMAEVVRQSQADLRSIEGAFLPGSLAGF
jgi:hypothetical protein